MRIASPEVALISSMGNDLTVVNAARVSFAKHSHELTAGDERLIRYLAENGHWTPFAHVMFTFRIKMPVFVARQWFRHTVGMARNEVSRRYVDDPPEYFVPDGVRERALLNKQGSGGEHCQSPMMREVIEQALERADATYALLLSFGAAPEQARTVLPLAHMTEFYETGALAAYARIFKLRADAHAQRETQAVVGMVGAHIQGVCPISWEALTGRSVSAVEDT